MKNRKRTLILSTPLRLLWALAAFTLSGILAHAVPYASSVTRSGNTVNFILNHDAQGLVVLRNGANPVYPGTNAGQHTFDMTGFTSYQIIVTGNTMVAWTKYVLDGSDRNFEYPYGVSINKNAWSTNFGKVYVSNGRSSSTGAGRAMTDGIYVLRADGVGIMVTTGGRTWSGNFAPYKSMVGPDDHLYVSDLSNDLAYEFNDAMTSTTALIASGNKTSGQYVGGIYVEGTKAAGNRKIYLVDVNTASTRKGLIGYTLGANAAATAGDTGTQIIGPSYFANFPRDAVRDSSGNWYMNNYSAASGTPLISKFDGALTPPINSALWEGLAPDASAIYAWCVDICESAGLVANGDGGFGTVMFYEKDTGTYVTTLAAGNAIREVAFDAAGNMVTVDNADEYARFWSPGGNTITTTSSDGSFAVVSKPPVTLTAMDSTAAEAGPDGALLMITRSGDTSGSLVVPYTLTGTAVSNVDYTVSSPSPITFGPGETMIFINITPIDDGLREPTETAVFTLAASANYSIAAPGAVTVTIADDDLQVRYWDGNGTDFGAGFAPGGAWTGSFWSTSVDGTSAPGAWQDWAQAVFAAGGDAWGAYTVTVSGTQRVDGPVVEEGSVTLTGGTIVLTNFSGIAVAAGASNIINSQLTGSSGLTKDQPGALVLGGANTYTGPTAVNDGLLLLGAAGAIPDGSAVSLGATAVLDLNGYNETIGSLAGAAGSVANVPAGSTLTFGGDNTAYTLWEGETWGNGLVAKVGTGVIDIGSAGLITNTLAISNGAVLISTYADLGNNTTEPTATADIIIDGGRLLHTSASSGSVFVPNGRAIVAGAGGGTVELESPSAVLIYGDATRGQIRGGTLIKDGPGELRVNGNPQTNSTFQKLVVRQGTYRGGYTAPVQGERFLGAIPGSFIPDQITLSNGAMIAHSLSMFEVSPNRGVVLGAGGGRIGDASGNWSFPGIISGTQLLKDRGGILVLGGANTYPGGTVVSSGSTLYARNTTGSATGSGGVTVTGATLGGDGRIGGPVVMNAANLTPGYSYSIDFGATPVAKAIAKLVLTNGLDMSAGATNTWQLGALSTSNPGTDFDQLELTGGNLSLGGTSVLVIQFTGTATAPDLGTPFWQQSHQWKIISFSGSAANPGNTVFSSISGTNGITAGTFATVADASGVTLVYTSSMATPTPVTSTTIGPVSGGNCTINYSGGSGSQFVLVRSANVAALLSTWTRIATNTAATGTFTIPVNADPRQFYRIISE